MGSGTTLLAAGMSRRKGIGIDLNPEYKEIYEKRVHEVDFECDNEYIIGDSEKIIDEIGLVDYIVTSPPYHNILRNKSKGDKKQYW